MIDIDMPIPSRVRIKICGITRPQDAIAAAYAGTDAIGLNFYPESPRYVTINTAKTIVKTVPPFVTIVGLFVDAKKDEINTVLDSIPLDLLQFHGNESDDQCQQYSRPYIKAVRMRDGIRLDEVADQYPGASALLMDTYVKDTPGGTGMVFDWSLISGEINKPVILAGGLTPGNVREAISRVKPYGVDVSGGVEACKGIKDVSKITAFINEVTVIQNEYRRDQ